MKARSDHAASRRSFIAQAGRLALTACLTPVAQRTLANAPAARTLALKHTHTGESLSLVYAVDDQYVPGALQVLNRFLRDHYTGQVGDIDPRLFDQLHELKSIFGRRHTFQVISGYRCQDTNEMLRQRGGGGVARRSLHLEGRAIDMRLAGVALTDLRDAALALKAGGVGYYAKQDFVHLDTGRIRSW